MSLFYVVHKSGLFTQTSDFFLSESGGFADGLNG